MTLIAEIREPKILKAISEMSALKYTAGEIKSELKVKYKINVGEPAIRGIIKQFSVRGNQFLASEKDLAEALRNGILEILDESKKNVQVTGEYRDKIREKIQLMEISNLLDNDENKKIKLFLDEIREMIKVQNNSILTMKGVLELLDKQKSTIEVSAVESIQMTKKDLLALERAGMIMISPKYKKQIVKESSP